MIPIEIGERLQDHHGQTYVVQKIAAKTIAVRWERQDPEISTTIRLDRAGLESTGRAWHAGRGVSFYRSAEKCPAVPVEPVRPSRFDRWIAEAKAAGLIKVNRDDGRTDDEAEAI